MSFASGKVALVTGGASGIGLCITKKLLTNELKGVTIADVDSEIGEKVARVLSEEFGEERVLFVKTDVTRQEDVEGAFDKTVATFNNLDIVINCAGIFNDKQFEKTIAINLTGTVRTSLLAFENYLPRYKSSSEALLINVASICGLKEFAFGPVYVATKHGVIGFSKSLGTEGHYKRTHVRVLTICPGLTETRLIILTETLYYKAVYKAPENDTLTMRPLQNPDVIADSLEKIVKEGETGSVWLVEGGSVEKVNFSDYLKPY